MCPKFRPVALLLSLVIAGSFAWAALSHAQVSDPPATGGTKSRYVGGTPSASPWISLGYVLSAHTLQGFGSARWSSVGRSHTSAVRPGFLPARQLSW